MLRVVIGTFAVLAGLAVPAGAGERPRAFIELFTSQGCAACPAADSLVDDLNDQEDILAVTMPVKLWDFLGWPDTLATDFATKRQMTYSVARGDRDVYTPQMMLNGVDDLLGNDEKAIRAAIRKSAPDPLPVPIQLSVEQDILHIEVGAPTERTEEATLWLLVVDDKINVPVRGGENRGRKLTYYNVVRQMRPVGIFKGEPMALDLPLSDVEKAYDLGCFVIAQVDTFKGPGKIIGAGRLERLFPAREVQQ